LFFFSSRRRHTRCLSDWSSDVCSSDLAVLECLALPADSHRDGDGHGVINLRGEPLPYLRLRDRFKATGAAPQREHVLVVQHAGGRAGIAVVALYVERHAVIKSLGAGLDGLSGLSG